MTFVGKDVLTTAQMGPGIVKNHYAMQLKYLHVAVDVNLFEQQKCQVVVSLC